MQRLEDLGALLDAHPQRLVVGTGANGRMGLAVGLERDLAARGVTVEVLPTVAAVDRINELLRLGAVGWAGALHLTCCGVARDEQQRFSAACLR